MTEKTLPCPKCDGNMELKKSWELKGKGYQKSKTVLVCYLYKCTSCGATLRFPRKEERGENKQ